MLTFWYSTSFFPLFGVLPVLYFLVLRILAWSRLSHIPGPTAAGWTDLWLLRYVVPGILCTKMEDICNKHGALVRVGPNWVVCSDGSEIQRIWGVRSGFSRAPWYKATRLDPAEDNVLTLLDTMSHHKRRKLLLPAYSGKSMPLEETYVDEQIKSLLLRIERECLSTETTLYPCNITRLMQYLTQDIITAIAFGQAAGYLQSGHDTHGVIETCERLLAPGHIIMFLPMVRKALESRLMRPFLPKPRPTDERGVGRLLGLINSHVDGRYTETSRKDTGSSNNSGPQNNDMLQAFVNSGLSRPQVEAEALVTLFGGTDSTSTALRMTIFFLSTNPRACRLLQAEIDGSVGEAHADGRNIISNHDATKLPYLQSCIKEAMRLWPPSMALLPKVSDRDQVICGQHVPAGTNVGWAAMAIMKDADVFGDNADVFEPARWTHADEATLKRMQIVYGLVFASGTEWECLGKRLAYEELGKVVYELFLRYDFAMIAPMEPFQWINHGFTVHRNMNVKIMRRESQISV